MRKFAAIVFALVLMLAFAGCGNTPAGTTPDEKKTVVVGASPLLKDMLTVAKEEFDKDGYTMDLKIFDDLVTPNIALQEGSVDVNFFQHEPYLLQFNKNKGTNLVKYQNGIVKYYMALFSKKFKNVNDLPEGASVSIPNDPSNRSRALKVLQTHGLIKLKEGAELPTKLDIVENNKNLNIIETDVMKLVTSLDDVDLSVINSLVAVQGNLDPKSALAVEDKGESDKFSLVIAVKKDQGNEKYAERLEKALKSEKVKQFLETKYKGAVLPLF